MAVERTVFDLVDPTCVEKYKPVKLEADLSALPAKEIQALKLLAQASLIIDEIFLVQSDKNNLKYKRQLADSDLPNKDKYISAFDINMGVLDRLGEVERHGANFYPEDMKKEEFEEWAKSLSSENQAKAKGFYWLIRRNEDRKLYLQEYNKAYEKYLVPLSNILKKAADLVENASVKKFLKSRAESFLSNDYYQSEIDWLKMDSSTIDVTCGPYEVYEDELLNLKAAFEIFVGIRDKSSTSQLTVFSSNLQHLEDNMPCESKYKRKEIKQEEPIVVINQICKGGDRGGPMCIAFNLPNDEKVADAHGHKLVMIKNLQQKKFEYILGPISKFAIHPDQVAHVDFESYYTHTLCHEVCHSLGPHTLDPKSCNGNESVRQALGSLHSGLEESKADALGLWALQFLIKNGKFGALQDLKSFHVTFLAGIFRSVRFGIRESHGKGLAMVISYFTERGAYAWDQETETYKVVFDKVDDVLCAYLSELLAIQGDGNKEACVKFCSTYGKLSKESELVLSKIKKAGVPVDLYGKGCILEEDEKNLEKILSTFTP